MEKKHNYHFTCSMKVLKESIEVHEEIAQEWMGVGYWIYMFAFYKRIAN